MQAGIDSTTTSVSCGLYQNITPRKIRILGVPLDLGQARRGVDMGPSAVRVAGLEARLEALGHVVEDGGNIAVAIAEQKIAALEGAEGAVVTASGMAAISSALLGALKSGDELISTAQLYGGTYRLMRDVFGDRFHLGGIVQ